MGKINEILVTWFMVDDHLFKTTTTKKRKLFTLKRDQFIRIKSCHLLLMSGMKSTLCCSCSYYCCCFKRCWMSLLIASFYQNHLHINFNGSSPSVLATKKVFSCIATKPWLWVIKAKCRCFFLREIFLFLLEIHLTTFFFKPYDTSNVDYQLIH